ncbi:AcrR family transcriptional regulator [Paenibacillus sp. PvP094]|uniref:TetR/AcrR family transcriptional regulator n=1 Tax=Paenibacillus sp. PvP094 TaxID=3156394 RepID=UPI0033907A29
MNENWHQQLKNKHRDDLISAGKELFLNYGLFQMKIKDVCTKAKLSRVTFYKHFQSMDDLLLSIHMELIEHLTNHVSRAAAEMEFMNGYEQLAAMLNAWITFARNYPDHIRFIQLFDINYESYEFNQELKERYQLFTQNGKERHFLLGALSRGTVDGSIRSTLPPLHLAQFIFTAMMGMLQKSVSSCSNILHASDTQMPEQFVSMLLQYVYGERTSEES